MRSQRSRWIVAIAAAAISAFSCERKEAGEKHGEGKPEESRLSRSADGEPVVTLSVEERKRVGLEVQELKEVEWKPEVVAYGTLEEDPERAFTLKSPAVGIVQAKGGAWPRVGQTLHAGAVVGVLEPRWTPSELADRAAKLADARAAVEEATAALNASRAAHERLKSLNERDKNISDRAVEDAYAKMKGDEAKLKAAGAAVKLYEGLTPKGLPPVELKIERGGQVAEVGAQPGEAVESGQTILHVAAYDKMIARVGLMTAQTYDPAPSSVRVTVLGYEDHPLTAHIMPGTPPIDPATLGPVLWIQVDTHDLPVQPGLPVDAHLPAPGKPRKGVTVPRSSVLRHLGHRWVYVEDEEGRFARRRLPDAQRTPDGWFVTSALSAGEKVVTTGAQLLLSEELKKQYEVPEGD